MSIFSGLKHLSSQWHAQAALRNKSWRETIFRIMADRSMYLYVMCFDLRAFGKYLVKNKYLMFKVEMLKCAMLSDY